MERTTDLFHELNHMNDDLSSFKEYQRRHPQEAAYHSLSDYLNLYLADHPQLSLPEVYRNANLSKSYAQQFFNGYRQHPDKYKLIALCIAMGMSVKETDRALLLANQPKLSPKIPKDAALIICINHKYQSVYRVNEFLMDAGLPTI